MIFNTKHLFDPGKLVTTMDISAGSSGKGKLGYWIAKHAPGRWQFACHAFMSNAAHTIEFDDGKSIMYQCLSSVATLKDMYEKTYICAGAVLELPALMAEIEKVGLNEKKLGIHPLAAIVRDIDIGYERGLNDFDGRPLDPGSISANMRIGSTLHGVGAARARRVLRTNPLLARDVVALRPFICDTREEIVHRLEQGQSGLMEIAQGFQLSYHDPLFYPKTTSRNCTVAAALDDCGIPPAFVGDVVLNARTFPIRVNSNKYIHRPTGKILTHADAEALEPAEVDVIAGDSGPGYPDQKEITWDEVSQSHGSKVVEMSTLTKLPRRVFTFSKQNLREAIRFNRPSYPHRTWLSVNFVNYLDEKIGHLGGHRGMQWIHEFFPKVEEWIWENDIITTPGVGLLCLGTGPQVSHMIQMS